MIHDTTQQASIPSSTRFELELFQHQKPTSKQVYYYSIICETQDEVTGWGIIFFLSKALSMNNISSLLVRNSFWLVIAVVIAGN